LPLLSSRYGVETTPQDEQPTPAGWRERLNRICDYLQRLAKEEGEASVSTVTPVPRCCARLMKSLTGEGFKSIEWEVQAAFRDGEALVAGDPIDFMAELCPLLLAWAGLSGRRDMERLAPQVTQLIALLNRPEKFEQQVAEHYRQKGWEAPAAPAEPPPPPEPPTPTPPSDPTLTPQAPTGPGPVPPRVTPGSAPGPPGSRTPEDREAMLSAAWRRSVEARREYEQLLAAGPVPAEPGEEESAGKDDAGPSDEPYREAVMEYERDAGRHPVAKPREQPGHDIDSHSHPEGHPERKLVRRIEVKGKGRPWVDAETVELTNRQFGDMLRGECDRPRAEDFDYWLYVVELEPEGGHQIVRVKNPARRTAKFELRGGTWRGEAEAGGDAP
jgi:hypothetical protein